MLGSTSEKYVFVAFYVIGSEESIAIILHINIKVYYILGKISHCKTSGLLILWGRDDENLACRDVGYLVFPRVFISGQVLDRLSSQCLQSQERKLNGLVLIQL